MVKMVRDATSCLRATITQQLQAGSRNAVAESLQPKKGRYKPDGGKQSRISRGSRRFRFDNLGIGAYYRYAARQHPSLCALMVHTEFICVYGHGKYVCNY
jgi:hypothetical protein